jgi:hypothetical protein
VSSWRAFAGDDRKELLQRNPSTARELLEHGIVGEVAQALVDLPRCAADCGCEDWQTCGAMVSGAWRAPASEPLPEARPKPKSRR